MENTVPRDWEENENKITNVIPKNARAAQVNHVWVGPTPTEPGHYERRPYVFQEYPKALYHPKYGTKQKPMIQDYDTPAKFTVALRIYERSDSIRTVTALNKKHEDELLAKGWMPKPPIENKPERVKDAEEI